MLAISLILNSLAFAGYVFICWFITSPHFIEAIYRDITGDDCDERRDSS